MAFLTPRLWCLFAVVMLWTPPTQSKEFTHEDIREAMLSIVHMMRLSEDKLERHEYREKALGEQLKKMLNGVDRRLRELDPLKGMLLRLDERLSNVETILLHKDDRERTNQKKTNEALESLSKSVQKLTTTVEELKSAKTNDLDNNLTTNEDSLQRRLDITDSKIEEVKMQIDGLKKNFNKESLHTAFLEVATGINPFEKHISNAEKLLNKYELKLNEYNVTKVPTDIVQLSDVALADEAWHSKMTDEMERQGKEVTKIQKLLSEAEGVWKQLPKLTDLQAASNLTQDAVVRASENIAENTDKSVSKVSTKLHELSERLLTTNEDIQRSLTEGNTLTERTYNRITTSYDAIKDELGKQTNNDKLMQQTAEDVIANKKKIEFVFHQLLSQITELVLHQGKTMNSTISDRLNAIEATIMGNQALTQVNLSSKLESEMSQVWRQIGILHAQLKATQQMLDKLDAQNEQYVNSSTTTMRNVDSNVNLIASQVIKLNDDFNFVLGQLGVTTQEFRQISAGLAAVIAGKNNTTPATEDGPGPHKISSAEKPT